MTYSGLCSQISLCTEMIKCHNKYNTRCLQQCIVVDILGGICCIGLLRREFSIVWPTFTPSVYKTDLNSKQLLYSCHVHVCVSSMIISYYHIVYNCWNHCIYGSLYPQKHSIFVLLFAIWLVYNHVNVYLCFSWIKDHHLIYIYVYISVIINTHLIPQKL